jgi:hypothetical protein
LIWYAILSDETPYMVLRTSSGWGTLMVVNLLLNWTLPFLLLLPRVNKRNPRILTATSLLILLGRVTDLYLMIMPPLSPATPCPAVWHIAMLALLAAGFVPVTLRRFFVAEPVPVGDPFFTVGGHGHEPETCLVRI